MHEDSGFCVSVEFCFADLICNKSVQQSIYQFVLFTHECLSVHIHVSRPFLSEQLSQDVAEMLLVVQRDVEEDGTWLNSDGCENWNLRTGSSLRPQTFRVHAQYKKGCFFVSLFLKQYGPGQSSTTKEEGSAPRWSHLHTETSNWMVNGRDEISAVKDVVFFFIVKQRIQAWSLYHYSCITCLSSFSPSFHFSQDKCLSYSNNIWAVFSFCIYALHRWGWWRCVSNYAQNCYNTVFVNVIKVLNLFCSSSSAYFGGTFFSPDSLCCFFSVYLRGYTWNEIFTNKVTVI